MTCPTVERLAEYQLNSLSPGRMETVRRHAEGCAACRHTLATLAQTTQLLDSVPAPVMPADLWAGVAARIQAKPRRLQQWWWKTTLATGMAASVLVGILVFRGQQAELMPTASPMAASYISDHQFLSAQDPLADRASMGAALASYRSEGE